MTEILFENSSLCQGLSYNWRQRALEKWIIRKGKFKPKSESEDYMQFIYHICVQFKLAKPISDQSDKKY